MATFHPTPDVDERYKIPEDFAPLASTLSIDELNHPAKHLSRWAELGLVHVNGKAWWFSEKGEALLKYLKQPRTYFADTGPL